MSIRPTAGPSSHGTATVLRLAMRKVDVDFRTQTIPGFILGSNLQPGQQPPDISQSIGEWRGQVVEVRGERTENPDFCTVWEPGKHPGMALTIGFAGSGKGGLIIPAAMTYAGNMMLNDPKGELCWLTAQHLRSLGFKVANCDPFGEVQKGYADKAGASEPPMRYNPLAGLYPHDPAFPQRVATIGEALAIATGGDSFFNGTARDLIEGLVALEATVNPGKATLRMVRHYLTLSDDDFAAMVVGFLQTYGQTYAAAKLRGFSDMTGRPNQSTKLTAKEQTKFLDSEAIVRFFEPKEGEPTFSFDELAFGKLRVFVVLPGYLIGSYSGFSRLLFNQGLEAVQRNRRENLDTPVTFMMDEAGTALGHLDSVEQAYGLARGAGMVLWSFYQDLSQMQRDYPKSWETIFGNSVCLTVTGARDQATCEYISKYIGNMTITVESTNTSSGTTPGGVSTGSGTSTNAAARPWAFPDEIRQMDARNLLVLMPGTVGLYLQTKIQYWRDYRFNGCYRPDPKYGANPALPEPYPRGPYSMPTDVQTSQQGNRKAKRIGLIGGAVALLLWLLSGSFGVFLLVAVGVGAYVWVSYRKEPSEGWFIRRFPNGNGCVDRLGSTWEPPTA